MINNNDLILKLYEYAENLRMNSNFDSAAKYYKNYISYSNSDKKGYYGLFLTSIKCPNEEEGKYIHNLSNAQYFENLVALEKSDKDKLKLINKYVQYIYNYFNYFNASENVFINIKSSEEVNLFKAFEIIISFYPDSCNEQYVNSLETIASLALKNSDFGNAKYYYNKLVLINSNNANYYWNRLLSSLSCKNNEELIKQRVDFTKKEDYQSALKYASADMLSIILEVEDKWAQYQEKVKKEAELKRNKEKELESVIAKTSSSENSNYGAHIVQEQKDNKEIIQNSLYDQGEAKRYEYKDDKYKKRIDFSEVKGLLLIISSIICYFGGFALIVLSSMDKRGSIINWSIFLLSTFGILVIALINGIYYSSEKKVNFYFNLIYLSIWLIIVLIVGIIKLSGINILYFILSIILYILADVSLCFALPEF